MIPTRVPVLSLDDENTVEFSHFQQIVNTLSVNLVSNQKISADNGIFS